MKTVNNILRVIINAFFSSATPYLFGSKKRREAKEGLADQYKVQAVQTQADIKKAQIANPFESAAYKSAMATVSRKGKQTQQRFANVMGANANPEAALAAQQATQQAVAGTAGDIAVGAEAQKKAEIGQLRGLKEQQLGQAAQMRQAAINEQGSGWRDLFSAVGGLTPMVSGALKGGSAAVAQE